MLSTTLLLAASMVVGQADQPSAYEHMKGLESLIGKSVGEYELPDGRPEMGKAGARVVRRVSARWALKRSIVIFSFSNSIDGAPAASWLEFAGWDPKEDCIAHSILLPGGSSSTGVWSTEGDDLILKWSCTRADGVEYGGMSRVHPTGPDTYTWTMTDCTRNGESIADLPVVQCKREPISRKRAAK